MLAKIGLPVAFANLQWIILNLTDAVMVGQAGVQELAHMNAGRVLTWVFFVVGLGLLSGVVVFTARAAGAGDDKAAGDTLRQGAQFGFTLGAISTVTLVLVASPALHLIRIPPDQIPGATLYVQVMAFAFVIRLTGIAAVYFLEGIARTKPVMVCALSVLPLNVALNWVFIYGELGVPALGAAGAALGTVLSLLIEQTLLWTYLARMKDRARYGLEGRLFGPWRGVWARGRAVRRFGLAPGLASGMELGGFSVLSVIAAGLGATTAAAFTAVGALHMLSLCLTLGLASAAAVRVGNAVGENAPTEIPRRGLIATLMAGSTLLLFGALYALFPEQWIALFSREPDYRMLAVGMLVLLAPFLIFDAMQFVLLYALRAAGDQVMAAVCQIASFFLVMGGVGWLAVHVWQLGPAGLMWGLNAGMLAACVLLAARFWWLTRPERLEAQTARARAESDAAALQPQA